MTTSSVEWPAANLRGWSYYLRAANLLADVGEGAPGPQKQLGWGQWTKPQAPPADTCNINHQSFVCVTPDEQPDLSNPEVAFCGAATGATGDDIFAREQVRERAPRA